MIPHSTLMLDVFPIKATETFDLVSSRQCPSVWGTVFPDSSLNIKDFS